MPLRYIEAMVSVLNDEHDERQRQSELAAAKARRR